MANRRCHKCMSELTGTSPICPHCGYDNDHPDQIPQALPCGTMLHGRYLIGKMLGQGGFGITYIGFDYALEIPVCIKEYYPAGGAMRGYDGNKVYWSSNSMGSTLKQGRETSVKEARKAVKVRDLSSVVNVWDVFYENETSYIVMEYIKGITLKEYLWNRNRRMDIEECMRLLGPVIHDLHGVHQKGIIHRDISPDNLMIREDGKMFLLDLGAAKDLTKGTGQSSQIVAKRGFSPPEQYTVNGQIGPWTDVYSMCATIYWCMTLEIVPDPMDRMLGRPVVFPESFPDNVASVLKHGLEINPEIRIRDLRELESELSQAVSLEAAKNTGVSKKEKEDFRKKTKEEARLQKEEEVRKKAEEEARLQEEEVRKKEEEIHLQEEEDQREIKANQRELEKTQFLVEEEAQRKLEETRLLEEQEAQRRLEETQLLEEQEAQQKVEEARLLKEADDRKKAEEEARLKEEARRKAEEIRLKEEAEAKLKAEEARRKEEREKKLAEEKEARRKAAEQKKQAKLEEKKRKEEEKSKRNKEKEERNKAGATQEGVQTSNKRIKIIAGILIFLLCAGGISGYLYYQKTLEREVPSVVNMSLEEAEKLAAGDDGQSLKIEVVGEEYSDEVEKNSIISQKIEAGSHLKKGDVVEVVISKGALVTVPDLTGKSKEEAENQLNDLKLVYKESDPVYSDDIEKNHVVSQDVAAGSTVDEETPVSIVLSKGALVTVPNLAGKSEKKAKEQLEKLGLQYQKSDSVYSDDVKKDHVISQDIAADTKIEENSVVSVVVSKGIEQVKVPDLSDKTVEKAKSALKKAKLEYDEENSDYSYSDDVGEGHIISQSIDPGNEVDKNSKISCIISQGPRPVEKKSSSKKKKKSSSSHKKSSKKKKGTSFNDSY